MRRNYTADDIMDFADSQADPAPRMAATDGITGVALPEDMPQPGAIISADKARRLGAQLLLAADEHDVFVEAVLAHHDRSQARARLAAPPA